MLAFQHAKLNAEEDAASTSGFHELRISYKFAPCIVVFALHHLIRLYALAYNRGCHIKSIDEGEWNLTNIEASIWSGDTLQHCCGPTEKVSQNTLSLIQRLCVARSGVPYCKVIPPNTPAPPCFRSFEFRPRDQSFLRTLCGHPCGRKTESTYPPLSYLRQRLLFNFAQALAFFEVSLRKYSFYPLLLPCTVHLLALQSTEKAPKKGPLGNKCEHLRTANKNLSNRWKQAHLKRLRMKGGHLSI